MWWRLDGGECEGICHTHSSVKTTQRSSLSLSLVPGRGLCGGWLFCTDPLHLGNWNCLRRCASGRMLGRLVVRQLWPCWAAACALGGEVGCDLHAATPLSAGHQSSALVWRYVMVGGPAQLASLCLMLGSSECGFRTSTTCVRHHLHAKSARLLDVLVVCWQLPSPCCD
jgi:hypothetical protein